MKKYPSAENDEIVFDANANNIFRLFETMYGDFVLRISLNNGEPFSWQTKYSSDSKIFISNDDFSFRNSYILQTQKIFSSQQITEAISVFIKLLTERLSAFTKSQTQTNFTLQQNIKFMK
ncbi:MAG: hypothetical protein U5J96_00430 [Ignavibacteriaceae bacterium]|nr:hypothetical protein [Ignavibacteriaceae bacterium]